MPVQHVALPTVQWDQLRQLMLEVTSTSWAAAKNLVAALDDCRALRFLNVEVGLPPECAVNRTHPCFSATVLEGSRLECRCGEMMVLPRRWCPLLLLLSPGFSGPSPHPLVSFTITDASIRSGEVLNCLGVLPNLQGLTLAVWETRLDVIRGLTIASWTFRLTSDALRL
ncbi:hypothetical protein BV22DRAFT_1038940 [Leucogyrophana mollusca]|uniref:Uncharacterized protein n=1 Tax=Leucogyrophana mollusca TaxID=85980 RepID=A0ACB8B7L0_9AGAM|nr:hypothetical protein BV22DRAFT_1038940 [Leucogyrophana mollusca]